MSVHEQNNYFDDKALAAMIVAYDRACGSLQPLGLSPMLREMIGKRIIEAAKRGERDAEILHQQVIKALSIREATNEVAA